MRHAGVLSAMSEPVLADLAALKAVLSHLEAVLGHLGAALEAPRGIRHTLWQ